jgi:hypothetical protein
MRRIATLITAVCVLASMHGASAIATRSVAARCRLVASVDGPVLTVRYRLWNGGARKDWRVKVFRDGELAYQKVWTTDAEGRFRVVRTFENERGKETILGTAKRLDDGVVCRVSVRV